MKSRYTRKRAGRNHDDNHDDVDEYDDCDNDFDYDDDDDNGDGFDDRSEKQRAEWKNYAKGLSEIYASKGQVKSCVKGLSEKLRDSEKLKPGKR